jgi:hypothetical protein
LIAVRRHALRLLEDANEMKDGKSRYCCEPLTAYALGEVVFNVLLHALERTGRQTAAAVGEP